MDTDGLPTAVRPANQDLVAAAAVGIVAVDATGVIVSANAAASSMLGWFEAELVGRPLQDVLKSDRSDEARAFGNAVRRLMHVDDDAFRRRNGTLLPVWWATTPLRDSSSGTTVGAVLTFGDTTMQRARAAADAADAAQGRAELAAALENVATLEWVAELAQVLSSTLDETEVLARLTRLATGHLGDVVIADHIDETGTIQRVSHAAAGWLQLDIDEIFARPEIAAGTSAQSTCWAQIMAGGIAHIPAERMADDAYAGISGVALLSAVHAVDAMVVPLVARGRTIGALHLMRVQDTTVDRNALDDSALYTDLERVIALDVAYRSALALDNARLYRAQSDIAGRLQKALLPSVPSGLPVRAAVRYHPAQNRFDVGGDWYDLFRCPSDSQTTVLVVGDVAGHDLAAGTTMSALRNLLRGIAVATAGTPSEVLEAVDNNLGALAISGTATIMLMNVTPAADGDWLLTWSNAGHMPPLLLLPDRSVVMLDEVHGPLLGTHLPVTRGLSERVIPAGSTLVLYTDGMVEVRGETIDVGLTRLRRTALTLRSELSDPDSLADELLSLNQASAEDDTAMLVCHLPGRATEQ